MDFRFDKNEQMNEPFRCLKDILSKQNFELPDLTVFTAQLQKESILNKTDPE